MDSHIYELAHGPSRYVKNFNGSFINGFKFHTKQFGEKKTSFNSGVCVIGICYNDIGNDFYGILTGIIELEYPEFLDKVVLFKCDWFDTTAGVRVHHWHGLVEVTHKSRLASSDPYVLAHQAQLFSTPRIHQKNEIKVVGGLFAREGHERNMIFHQILTKR